MARYNDADEALQIIDSYAKTVDEDGKVIVDAVRDIVSVITPTADVVEAVRCKDCIHWQCKRKGGFNEYVGDCYNNDFPFHCESRPIMAETDYCSYGERKEERTE